MFIFNFCLFHKAGSKSWSIDSNPFSLAKKTFHYFLAENYLNQDIAANINELVIYFHSLIFKR